MNLKEEPTSLHLPPSSAVNELSIELSWLRGTNGKVPVVGDGST